MNKTITVFRIAFSLLVVFGCTILAEAQLTQRPPVLALQGNQGYTAHFNTQTQLNTALLQDGVENQATIEFWAKTATTTGTGKMVWQLANLKTRQQAFTLERKTDEIQIKVGEAVASIELDEPLSLNDGAWHHFALVFNTQTLATYIDGIRVSLIDYGIPPEGFLYLSANRDESVQIAEYRAWNQARTQPQIESLRFRTLAFENAGTLNELADAGLVAAFAGTDYNNVENRDIPMVRRTAWGNLFRTVANNLVTVDAAVFVGEVSTQAGESIALGMLDVEADHPIFGLRQVLLTASDGNGIDAPNAGGRSGVALQWPHIAGVNRYLIRRRDVGQQGPSIVIHQVAPEDLQNAAVSELIRYFDSEILPGQLYEYRVEPFRDNTEMGTAGIDVGFVFPNGELAGQIQTPLSVATRNALVQAVPVTGSNPGGALAFAVNSPGIGINDVSIFETAQGSATIEFWYKTPSSGHGSNTVFRLNDGEITLNDTHIRVTLGGQLYLESLKPNDGAWHHFAFAYSLAGGQIFVDGGLTPTNGASQIQPNATTTQPFTVMHRPASQFLFNADAQNAYHLDEIRIWKGARSPVAINQYKNHMIAGVEVGLLAYYRLDMGDRYHIYNQANTTRGRLAGTTVAPLTHLTAAQQAPITMATYTDANGRYAFTSLNAGQQGAGGSGNARAYAITPSRPNSAFMPESRVVDIDRALNPPETTANFTDVSALPASGRIVYRVPDTSSPTGFLEYPSVRDTGIELDGQRVASTDPNAQVATGIDGVYAITAAPGRHTITVAPQQAVDGGNNAQRFDRMSLGFDKGTGYAVSRSPVAMGQSGAFTWSGFVRPNILANPNDTLPEIQTVLHWGAMVLELRDNSQLVLVYNDTDILSAPVEEATFAFFGITGHAASNTIGFFVNGDFQSAIVPHIAFEAPVYVGAQVAETTHGMEGSGFSRANIDQLEYRNKAYNAMALLNIQDGNIIENDAQHLVLSYNFEHLRGERAINLAVDSVSNENNFLMLAGNAFFDETASANYRRSFDFDYLAINEAFNPVPGSGQYELNITEPVSSLNFENTTRRAFVGNIVVPCGNSVGGWSGQITRTDIAFPEFALPIGSDNFNQDFTMFTVRGLLPGQYRVSLAHDATGRELQSPIIDLRAGNQSFDFQFRNELEFELTLQGFDLDGLNDPNNISTYYGKVLEASCDGNHVAQAGDGIAITVSVFERYGDERCPVEGAQVNVSGDMIIAQLGIAANDLGNAQFITQLGAPNFLGDFLRNLNVAVSHEGRQIATQVSAYLTGALRGNADFTLVNPAVGFVLHDPPGDGSTATLERGTSYSHNFSFEEGTDVAFGYSGVLSGGIDLEMTKLSVTAPAGIGIAVGTTKNALRVSLSVETGLTSAFNYRNIGGNGYSVSLEQSITTPSFDDYVGQDADVYIGTSNVLTFGTGQSLEVDNCVPRVHTDRMVMTAEEQTPFVFTQQQVIDEVIPDLQRLAIARFDELNGTNPANLTEEEQQQRSSLDLSQTIINIGASNSDDSQIVDFLYQVDIWKGIVETNRDKLIAANFMNHGVGFAETTSDLETVGNDLGSTITQLDEEIAFSAGPSITYSITREVSNSSGETTGGGVVNNFNSSGTIGFGSVETTLNQSTSISGLRNNSTTDENRTTRVDSFTLTDDDPGDQFNVRIRRDPDFDTPMFLTTAGQSTCPFESGTVPRQGVEITADRTVGFGTGDETILYNLTLRNTQIAADNTPKTYTVMMDAASNPLGALVLLNESPIFEPGTATPFTFGLDGNSPTGVRQEATAQLRIGRGSDAPSDIAFEDIAIRIFAGCEQNGFGFTRFRQDEYAEVGVVPFQEIKLSAYFRGACIENIEAALPATNWVVNNTDNNVLPFRFRVPELANSTAPEGLSVLIEYAIEGNNTPLVLERLTMGQLMENLDPVSGFVAYDADVSALANGTYSFRVTPLCDDGGADIPSNRMNPTEFVQGTISRVAPTLVATNPIAGGILADGEISATFSAAINPATANNSTVSLRGVLGGVPAIPVSAELAEITDEVVIPHQPIFNIEGAFTIEMWVNPFRYPASQAVPIFEKGSNYKLEITQEGRIRANNSAEATLPVQPFEWTHVAVVYDGIATLTIYYNGAPVGSAPYQGMMGNVAPIHIANVVDGDAFVGRLDEIRVWAEARSPLAISTNLDQQLLGNETNLVAYFVLDDNALEGIDGAPDEAIRDFTGNAIGTTATGLSFVQGEADAAPLDLTSMVQDLQFNIVFSQDNTVMNIVPVFEQKALEGAQLTAMIHDRKLQDPAGNPLAGADWDFVINQNVIAWSQNNIQAVQAQGSTTRVTEVDLVNEQGGIPISYRFTGLPAWLSVTTRTANEALPITVGAINRIEAGQTVSNLEFVVAPFLNPGKHTTNVSIETFNADTGTPLGVETFQLTVTVFCPPPPFADGFSQNNFLGSMNLVGSLLIDGARSWDTRDILAVYLNNEFRGTSTVDIDGLVRLPVFGGPEETGTLRFEIWDASECTKYNGILEEYAFQFRQNIGSTTAPVTFTVGEYLTSRIAIVPGFQEVSFNLQDSAGTLRLSMDAIKGMQTGDRILDAATFELIATVNADGNIIENAGMSSLDVRKAYIIHSTAIQESILDITGLRVPVDTNIPLLGNQAIQGIAYLPEKLLRTPVALRSLTATSVAAGDRIERRGLSAEYTIENGWVGSLTHLTPGLGYLYSAQQPGILNYSGIVANENLRVSTRPVQTALDMELPNNLGWQMDINTFPQFMYVTAVLAADGLDNTRAYPIAAFVDNKVRGVAISEIIDGQRYYFLGIGGLDTQSEVKFKLYDGKQILALDNTINFEPANHAYDFGLPLKLTLEAIPRFDETTLGSEGYALSPSIPNPIRNGMAKFTYTVPRDQYVEVALYNVYGQEITTFVSGEVTGKTKHTIEWNADTDQHGLVNGLYFVRLTSGGRQLQQKVMLVR